MAEKIKVGVLFGGRSAEHEISLLSAKNVIQALDPDKYDVVLVGIDKNGEWHLRDDKCYLMHADNPKLVHLNKPTKSASLVPKEKGNTLGVDVVFPVLHGTYGEDGTVQGLLKLANVPFVGAGVLGSAVGMDKDVMKRLFRDANIPTAKFLTFTDKKDLSYEAIAKKLKTPFFVKPANLGSSVGISKVKSRAEFTKAIDEAFSFDRKILIEEFIDGRELECSIIGNENPIASVPGEVLTPLHEFYSYEAKYHANGAVIQIPAQVDKKTVRLIQKLSLKAYKTVCCEGLARIDCFLKKNGEVYINEINTIPGFTNTSPYPKMWKASGLEWSDLLDQLITLAIDRHKKENALKTDYTQIS